MKIRRDSSSARRKTDVFCFKILTLTRETLIMMHFFSGCDFGWRSRRSRFLAGTAVGMIASGVLAGPAQAACTTSGTVTTCTGDVSAGVPDLFAPVNRLIVENTTTVLGGRSIFLRNSSSDVSVEADFSPQGLVNDPTGFGPDDQTGVQVRAFGGTADVTLTGDMTISAGPDVAGATSRVLTNHQSGVQIVSDGSLRLVQTGDVVIEHADLASSGSFPSVDIERFSGIELINNGEEPAPGALTLERQGNLTVRGPDMTASTTETDASGSSRAIVNDLAASDGETLYGILVLTDGDMDILNVGDILVEDGARTATAASVGGRAEAVTDALATSGIGVPADPDGGPFAGLGRVDRRANDTTLVQTGDLTVRGGPTILRAIAATQPDGPAAEAALRQTAGDFGGLEVFGVRMDNLTNLDATFTGDLLAEAGLLTAEADALAGPDDTIGNVTAQISAAGATAVRLRGRSLFTENDTDNDSAAVVTIDGTVTARGGAIEAAIAGTGLARQPVSTFPPPEDGALGSIRLTGGDATGIDISGFEDETTISADPERQSRTVETVSQMDIALTGPVLAEAGSVSATLSGSGLPASLTGGRALALGTSFNAARFDIGPDVTLTARGGDASLTLEGSHGPQSVLGGSAQGTFIRVQGPEDAVFDTDVEATGGHAALTGDAGRNPDTDAPGIVRGGEAVGLGIGHDTGLFNSEQQALSPEEAAELQSRVLRVTGNVTATGGDATADDPDTRATGGDATGVDLQFGGIFSVEGEVTSTAGSGPDGRGAAVGVALDGGFFPDFVPLDRISQEIRIAGDVTATGSGKDIADPATGRLFSTEDTLAAGVRLSRFGLQRLRIEDGGRVTARGDFTHGVIAAAEANEVSVQGGGTISAEGAGASGIEIRPFQDISISQADSAQGTSALVTIAPGGTVTSAQGFGIRDDGRRAAVDLSDPAFPRFVETYENATTLDQGGTVTGGNGTAADLGSGTDRVILRDTSVTNGDILLGTGNDRLAFEDGFTLNSVIDGGPGTDIVEADVGAGLTRVFDLAAQPVQDFEVIEKTGAGRLSVEGGTIAPAMELRALGGLTDIVSDQRNLAALIEGGAALVSRTRLASVTNRGSLSVGTDETGDIATLQIDGDLSLEAAGRLNLDVRAPDLSDLIEVGGQTALGGALDINGLGMLDAFEPGNRFTVIRSAGGVTGAFDSTTDNLPDLDFVVSVDPDADGGERVTLGFATGDPSDKALHPNTLQSVSRLALGFNDLLIDRSARADGARRGGSAAVSRVSARGTVAHSGQYAWGRIIGSFQDIDGSATVTGYEATTGGLAFGYEHVSQTQDGRARLGVSAGYSVTELDAGASTADMDSYFLGIHGSLERGNWLLSGALGFGVQDYDLTRRIAVGAGSVAARGSADGHFWTASAKLGYDIATATGLAARNQTRIAPYLRLDHVHVERDGFTETGAGALDLTVSSDDFSQSAISLGIETSARFAQPKETVIRPYLDLRWQHVLDGRNATSNAFLTSAPGVTFATTGATEDRNRFAIRAGLGIDVSETTSLDLHYGGTFAESFSDHSARLGLTVRF